VSAPLGTQTYPSYLDVTAQVKPWLQFSGITLTATASFVLELITDSICTQAQRFIGGPIAPTTYGPATGIGKFDGSGGLNSGYIMLPKYPVVQVTELVEYRGGAGVVLTEVTPTSTPTGTGYQLNYRTGRLTRVLGGMWNRPFYPGSNNVWVTWTAGYNPIPQDIVRASLEWVAHIYRNTQQVTANSPRGVGPTAEYEAATMNAGLWAGIPNRVTDVLKTYVHLGIR
jgi:hypothetical protein